MSSHYSVFYLNFLALLLEIVVGLYFCVSWVLPCQRLNRCWACLVVLVRFHAWLWRIIKCLKSIFIISSPFVLLLISVRYRISRAVFIILNTNCLNWRAGRISDLIKCCNPAKLELRLRDLVEDILFFHQFIQSSFPGDFLRSSCCSGWAPAIPFRMNPEIALISRFFRSKCSFCLDQYFYGKPWVNCLAFAIALQWLLAVAPFVIGNQTLKRYWPSSPHSSRFSALDLHLRWSFISSICLFSSNPISQKCFSFSFELSHQIHLSQHYVHKSRIPDDTLA